MNDTPTRVLLPTDFLVHDDEHKVWRVPKLDGSAYHTTEEFMFDGPGRGPNQATFGLPSSRSDYFVMDNAIKFMMGRDIPHTTLKKYEGGYYYEPWGMWIVVDVVNPGWGNSFKVDVARSRHWKSKDHTRRPQFEPMTFPRLGNVRALLKLIKEKQ